MLDPFLKRSFSLLKLDGPFQETTCKQTDRQLNRVRICRCLKKVRKVQNLLLQKKTFEIYLYKTELASLTTQIFIGVQKHLFVSPQHQFYLLFLNKNKQVASRIHPLGSDTSPHFLLKLETSVTQAPEVTEGKDAKRYQPVIQQCLTFRVFF